MMCIQPRSCMLGSLLCKVRIIQHPIDNDLFSCMQNMSSSSQRMFDRRESHLSKGHKDQD